MVFKIQRKPQNCGAAEAGRGLWRLSGYFRPCLLPLASCPVPLHHWTVWLCFQDEQSQLSKPLLVMPAVTSPYPMVVALDWSHCGMSRGTSSTTGEPSPCQGPTEWQHSHLLCEPLLPVLCLLQICWGFSLSHHPGHQHSCTLTQGDPWGVSLVTIAKLREHVRILCLEEFNFCWSIHRDVRRIILKVYGSMYFTGNSLISVRIYFEMSIILKYLLLSKAWNIIWF